MAYIGNAYTAKVTFYPDLITSPSTAGDPAGTVTVQVEDPTGLKTTYTYVTSGTGGFTHTLATGVYTFTFTPTIAGIWWTRWVAGPGSGQAADEADVLVQASNIV